MPTIETSTWINAPIETVYEVAKNNEAFPEFMDDVESLEIVSKTGDTIVSAWVGKISAFGVKVRWTQEDTWDDNSHTCHFKQLKGDYDQMSGIWQFKEVNGGTQFESTLLYEYRVPGLGPLVGKVVYGLVVKNMEGVLNAIKTRAENLA